ncbi:MAG TPA: SMP-30/gluconolactonase/LRE family protein [Dongiaceae bacterium]|nr:SMP-30/gluconolactonase/LRE family protein [Dongiaceae bacterium]
MKKPVTVLAQALGHPEGPYVLPDGRVVFANSYRSEIAVWDAKKGTGRYAFTGGAPNACMLGTDGHVYITNCPNVGKWVPEEKRPPSIQRASPDGKVEIVATEADGVAFDGPNDLTFGPDGRLYFTDSGDWDPETKPHKGRIVVIERDGTAHILEELDHTYPNGIVAEPDGSIVWVESYTLRMVRRRPDGSKQVIHTFPEKHIPDGFKIDADGNFWVTTVSSGGVDVVAKDGSALDFLELESVPLNCVFGGASLYVADFGVFDTSGPASMGGRLLKVDVGVAGMPLFKGAIG